MRATPGTVLFSILVAGVVGCTSEPDPSDGDRADQASQKLLAGIYRLEQTAGVTPVAGDFRVLVLQKDGESFRDEVPTGPALCTTTATRVAEYDAKPKSQTDREHGKLSFVSRFFVTGGENVETYDYVLTEDGLLTLRHLRTGQTFTMRRSKDKLAHEGEGCMRPDANAKLACESGLVCAEICGSQVADFVCQSPEAVPACPEQECASGQACATDQFCLASNPDVEEPDCGGICVIDGRDLDTVDDAEFIRVLSLLVPSDKFAFKGTKFEPNIGPLEPAKLPAHIDKAVDSILDERRQEEKSEGFSRFEIHVVDEMLFSLSRDGRLIGYVVTTISKNGSEDLSGADFFFPGDRLFFNERGYLIEESVLAPGEEGP